MELVDDTVLNAEVIIWLPSLVQDCYSFLIDFNQHLIRKCESPVANSYFILFQGRLFFLFYKWHPKFRLGKICNLVFDSWPLRVSCTEIVCHRLGLFISSKPLKVTVSWLSKESLLLLQLLLWSFLVLKHLTDPYTYTARIQVFLGEIIQWLCVQSLW